jgi:hypothetical protein
VIVNQNSISNEENGQRNIYKAKFNIEKLYKGNSISEFDVWGSTDYTKLGSCEILLNPNERYLAVVQKNANGKFLINRCTPLFLLDDKKPINQQIPDLENLFSYLEKNKNNLLGYFVDYYDSSKHYDEKNKVLKNDFKKTFGEKLKGKFGIYRIKIDDDRRIQEILPIKSIGLDDNKFQNLMKKNITIVRPSTFGSGNEFLLILQFK